MKKPAVAAVLLAALLSGLPPAGAYIESLYPLQQFIDEADLIAEGVIEKTDAKKGICFVRVTKPIKGKCPYELIRINVGVGQEWHPQAVLPHLVVGAPAVLFTNAERRAEIYVNRFFLQAYGDSTAAPEKTWWSFTHIEVRCNRTFNGPTEDLAKLLLAVQAGKIKPPPADPKAPAITKDSMKALPLWGQPVDAEKLPAPFVRRDPAAPRKAYDAENPQGLAKGLAFQYYEGAWDLMPDFDAVKPAATGVAEQFDLTKRKRDTEYGFRFSGYLDIPRDGLYRFTTRADDGSRLSIGKEEVAGGAGEAKGEIALKAGKHAIVLLYYQKDGPASLEVLWEGPDLPPQRVPAAALSHIPAP